MTDKPQGVGPDDFGGSDYPDDLPDPAPRPVNFAESAPSVSDVAALSRLFAWTAAAPDRRWDLEVARTGWGACVFCCRCARPTEQGPVHVSHFGKTLAQAIDAVLGDSRTWVNP